VAQLKDLVASMRANPRNIRFSDAIKVAKHYFGEPRVAGSHHIFKTPWPGDPRINLQTDKSGKAKKYQIDQLIQAIDLKESQP
jgi:hypothetical protein